MYEITTIGDVQPVAAGAASSPSLAARASALLADVRAQRTGLIVGLVVGAVGVLVYRAVKG